MTAGNNHCGKWDAIFISRGLRMNIASSGAWMRSGAAWTLRLAWMPSRMGPDDAIHPTKSLCFSLTMNSGFAYPLRYHWVAGEARAKLHRCQRSAAPPLRRLNLSRQPSPKFSTIRPTALHDAKIPTALIWQQIRSEFGSAHVTLPCL